MKRSTVLLLALALAACGAAGDGELRPPGTLGAAGDGELRPPGTLGAGALPGLRSRARSLDAAALAADVGTPALEDLLNDAGFLTGSEREFFGHTPTFNRVVARVLRFEDREGASRYLGWVRSHPEDVLGRAKAGRPPRLGESPLLFSLGPCGCHAEVPTFLVAWQKDATVFWLLAAGPGVTRRAVGSLGRNLDRVAG